MTIWFVGYELWVVGSCGDNTRILYILILSPYHGVVGCGSWVVSGRGGNNIILKLAIMAHSHKMLCPHFANFTIMRTSYMHI